MEQPPTPDRPDLVNPPAVGPTPAAPVPNTPAPEANGEPPPAPAVPLTPMAWLAQNGVYLVAFAVILGVLLYYQGAFWIIKVGIVVVGLGLVIFIHELGHFLAAKWCDVHVQTFSLGFGPAIPGCSFRRGETLYKIGILPLGGYVSMVGEGADADEEENYPRSFKNKPVGQRMLIISAGVVMNMILGCICFIIVFYLHGVPRIRGVVNSVEPASPAWSVGVRTGYRIASIGGKDDPTFDDLKMKVLFSPWNTRIPARFEPLSGDGPPVVVDLLPRRDKNDDTPIIGIGSPFKLQLRDSRWKKVLDVPCVSGSASAKARVLELKPGEVVLKASAGDNDSLAASEGKWIRWEALAKYFGEHVASPVTLEIASQPLGNQPATRTLTAPADGFHFGDKIIGTTNADQDRAAYDPLRVEPLPLDPLDPVKDTCDIFAFYKRVKRLAGLPIVIQVRREGQSTDDPPVNLLLPASFTPTTGMQMDMGRVAGIRNNSPAAEAGLKEGDKITRVEMYLAPSDAAAAAVGRPVVLADLNNSDPARLPFDLEQAANRTPGKKLVRISVVRENQGTASGPGDPHSAATPVALPPVPWDDRWDYDIEIPNKPSSPMAIPQLGVAYWVQCTVNQVQPGSPAADAGIKPGDRIAAIQVQQPGKKTEPDKKVWDDFVEMQPSRENGHDPDQWAFYALGLQLMSGLDCPGIRVKVIRDNNMVQENGKDKEFEITPTYDQTWPSDNLGLLFLPEWKLEKASSVWQAVELGFKETLTSTLQIYLTMRSLATGRIKVTKGLGGPIMIATTAFDAAEDPYRFLLIMAMISVNLAVLNFLPIPVLDGGHMVLLIYEKIRGKPPSDAWRNVLTIAGLIFLVLLMLGATFLDVSRIFKYLK